MGKPSSISEAIEKLENVSQSKSKDFKDLLEKDYLEVKKALDDLKPQLEELKANLGKEVKEAKNQVEEKVRENPWLALGVVGVIALIIGWILGQSRK